jgi:hypothetical protein
MESKIYNLFKFIEGKKPQYKVPFKVRLVYDPDSITEEEKNVEGDLDLSGTPIQSLPNGLKVGDSLILYNCTSLTLLPNDLKVEGGLHLENCTSLTSLPNDLKVGGYLNLSRTPIQSLPNDLKVGSSLWLKNTPIQSLPKDLKVKGNLYLIDTPLSKKYTKEQIRKMVPGVEGNIHL